jgi:hypothetical protein
LESWENELRQAETDFESVALPVLRRKLPRGEYLSVQTEGLTSPSAGLLDRLAGIDWLVSDGSGVSTVASRVQYVGTPFASFTIGRFEMDKRLRYIETGKPPTLGPMYTVQAYLRQRSKGPFLLAVIVMTGDLFRFVQKYPGCVLWKRNRKTGRDFAVVAVDCLWDAEVEARVVLGDECRAFRTRDGLVLRRNMGTFICADCRAEQSGGCGLTHRT